MQNATKEIINAIIEQWCDNKVCIAAKIDSDGNESYIVIKESKLDTKPRRRLTDRFKEDQEIDEEDIVCTIKIVYRGEDSEAYICFKSHFAIDNDFKGVYKYLKKLVAVIKAKIRQMNSWGVEVKLGIMSLEEFDKLDRSSKESKEEIINEIYGYDKDIVTKCD
ncbi:MAG: hypothetical protein V1872_09300 [bacterium]